MVELMQHQKDALDFLKGKSGAGLFFEMGLGKTLVTLEHLSRLQSMAVDKALLKRLDNDQLFGVSELVNQNWNLLQCEDSPFPALIVCPLSVISVWENEVKKFGYPFRVKKLIGSFDQRLDRLSEAAEIYVVNYEGMRIMQAQLEAKGFRTLVMDESHRIKERTSQQSAAAMSLGRLARYRFALTGTPVTKSPEDIWTQMQFVEPGALSNFWAFRNRYIDFKTIHVRMPNGIKEIKKAHRFKNLAELESKISEHCLRRTKAECLDLPEKIYRTVHCEMSPAQEKAYCQIKNSLAIELESGLITMQSAASALQKMQQVCQGFVYDEAKNAKWLKGNGKIDTLKDLLKDLEEEKVIIFGWYRADIEKLLAELPASHRVFHYHGNADERGGIVSAFESYQGPAIFLAQVASAAEGITIVSACNVIYYGLPWSYGIRMQSEDRAHRTGQRRNVIYHDLVCAGGVDERILFALRNKGELADKITGDSVRLAKMVLGLEELNG